MKKPLLDCLVTGHAGLRVVVGEDAVEPALDATSYSANLHVSEQ
jgi:hypothetical protein